MKREDVAQVQGEVVKLERATVERVKLEYHRTRVVVCLDLTNDNGDVARLGDGRVQQ